MDVFRVAKQMYFSSLTQGPKIKEFEELVARYVGAKYAVAVSSGTAGLHLALMALDLPINSEVVTTPISFVASSNSAIYNKLKPKFVDIDPETLAISTKLVVEEIDKNSKVSAVIPVHFAGFATDISDIRKISDTKQIKIIEDAAHALGASYPSGEKVGCCKYSDLTVFSLHPVKTITSGEGGVITTNNFDLYKKICSLRTHGIDQTLNNENNLLSMTQEASNLWYYDMKWLGFHYRMTEIQAVLGISQLKRIHKFLKRRRKITNIYLKHFKNLGLVSKFLTNDIIESSACHLFILRFDFSKLKLSKNALILELRKKKIGSQVHYKPITLNSYYSSLGYDSYTLPMSMAYYHQALSIPLYPNLKIRKVRRIIKTIKKICTDNEIN
jgi:dTDP-4-amino-4,6-dideoxygalactose transaminase